MPPEAPVTSTALPSSPRCRLRMARPSGRLGHQGSGIEAARSSAHCRVQVTRPSAGPRSFAAAPPAQSSAAFDFARGPKSYLDAAAPGRRRSLRHHRHRPGARPGGHAPGRRRRGADPRRRRAARRGRARWRARRSARGRWARGPVRRPPSRRRRLPARVLRRRRRHRRRGRDDRRARLGARARRRCSSGCVDRRAPERRWAVATALACAGVALLALAGGGRQRLARPASRSPSSPARRYASYTLAAKRLLSAGHAPEAVMAGAFGLGARRCSLPVLALSGAGWLAARPTALALALFLGVDPDRARVRAVRPRPAPAERVRDRDAHARRAADRRRARRGRAGRAVTALSAAGAAWSLAGLLALGAAAGAARLRPPSVPRHDR